MGHVERQVWERARNTELQRVILSFAERLEEFTSEALCGSIYKMYKLMDQHERRRKYRSVLAARDRLCRNGLLRRSGKFLKLTDAGARKLREWAHRGYQLPRPKKWDGRWRVLVFDIPEKQRPLRDRIRDTLQSIGFVQLQQSVWVYPFDCEDFITLLKADLNIGKNLLYLVVEGLENDRHLRDHFQVYTS